MRRADESELAADVREGLSAERKELSPKYFYDQEGSRLFERICELDEYYQTRTERSILEQLAPSLIREYAPRSIVELGSGSSSKTRLLLDAITADGGHGRYVPIDISREMLLETADTLGMEYPRLDVRAIVGDFTRELPRQELLSPALVIFLGGTIGNFTEQDAIAFVERMAAGMNDRDLFLLGIDLVKDPRELHAAYNDAEGVTARFNLNVLEVINRELGGHFDTSTFAHYAFYRPDREQIEMHLASLIEQRVAIDALGIEVEFDRGETILTEISRKFTRRSVTRLLEQGGLSLLELYSDEQRRFALALARKSSGSATAADLHKDIPTIDA